LVCAYLPPPMRGQPHLMREYERRACELLHEPPEIFDVSDRMADVWLTFAAARGIAHVDLRTRFRSTQQRLYWTTDTHVSVAGQQAIAKELLAQF
jgi:hypothetical protein